MVNATSVIILRLLESLLETSFMFVAISVVSSAAAALALASYRLAYTHLAIVVLRVSDGGYPVV